MPAALADGTYNVAATATDNAGNVGSDTTTSAAGRGYGESDGDREQRLTVTNNNKPTLTGTVSDPTPSSGLAGTVTVVVGGQTLTAPVTGTTWSVAVPTALDDGTYNVQATATDNAGNVGSDNTTNELDRGYGQSGSDRDEAVHEQQQTDVERNGRRSVAQQRHCRRDGYGWHADAVGDGQRHDVERGGAHGAGRWDL